MEGCGAGRMVQCRQLSISGAAGQAEKEMRYFRVQIPNAQTHSTAFDLTSFSAISSLTFKECHTGLWVSSEDRQHRLQHLSQPPSQKARPTFSSPNCINKSQISRYLCFQPTSQQSAHHAYVVYPYASRPS
jgi:hypothetical protein